MMFPSPVIPSFPSHLKTFPLIHEELFHKYLAWEAILDTQGCRGLHQHDLLVFKVVKISLTIAIFQHYDCLIEIFNQCLIV